MRGTKFARNSAPERSATQIIAEYEAEFGPESLAVPPNRGVLKAIWVVPTLGIALGAFGLGRMLRRWRRDDPPGGAGGGKKTVAGEPGPAAARDAYDGRIDDELKDLDG